MIEISFPRLPDVIADVRTLWLYSSVYRTLLARRARNLISVWEIHTVVFETPPSSNNVFVLLSKDSVRISYTAVDSDLVIREYSRKCT